MADHSIFIEANYDHATDKVEIAVLCSCTALLLESPWTAHRSAQVSLDEINEVRWAHYDSVEHAEPVCEVCGDCGE